MSRRTLLQGGGAAFAGLTVLRVAGPAHAFPGHRHDEVVLPWADQPPPPPPGVDLPNLLECETLESRLTPADDFFVVSHYPEPDLVADWRLAVSGLVARPRTLTLAELMAYRNRRTGRDRRARSDDH
jgi:DMSO/TMAO reductase YedYZ molybdopterin-dependent catalytic subunit